MWSGARLAAPAYPVRCTPGDNLAVHVAVARAPAGSVLTVDVGGEEAFGYWGEVLTTAAKARGIVGLVIDGGVRDTAALEAHGFPVFSTTVALRGASKHSPGAVGAPATVGDVVVAAGDWVVGDGDGVCVVPSVGSGCRGGRGPRPRAEGARAVRRPASGQHDARAPRPRPLTRRGGLTARTPAQGARGARRRQPVTPPGSPEPRPQEGARQLVDAGSAPHELELAEHVDGLAHRVGVGHLHLVHEGLGEDPRRGRVGQGLEDALLEGARVSNRSAKAAAWRPTTAAMPASTAPLSISGPEAAS